MAAHEELAVFRGYKSAFALDVLYHQAELLHLLQDWAHEVKEDQSADDNDRRSFEYYFQKLARPAFGKEHSVQWNKWLEVRQKLGEYRKAIATFRDVSSEPLADLTNVQTLRTWLVSPGAGNDFLRGSEADTWQTGVEHDLISLSRSGEKDTLTKWALGPFMSWVHDHITDRFKNEVELQDPFLADKPVPTPLKQYSNSFIEGVASTVSTILASLFPTTSIFALYYVSNPVVQMGMIVAFSTLFSAVLVLVARAKRTDCFAATAAFAAVQVVFVGQQTSASARAC